MLKYHLIKVLPIILFLGAQIQPAYAQVSPPGLGKAKTASWWVLGLKRKLDSAGTKEALTYIGLGTKSTPDDADPFHKQAIWVLNHEVYHKFAPNQQYSYALSYRRQSVYDDLPRIPIKELNKNSVYTADMHIPLNWRSAGNGKIPYGRSSGNFSQLISIKRKKIFSSEHASNRRLISEFRIEINKSWRSARKGFWLLAE